MSPPGFPARFVRSANGLAPAFREEDCAPRAAGAVAVEHAALVERDHLLAAAADKTAAGAQKADRPPRNEAAFAASDTNAISCHNHTPQRLAAQTQIEPGPFEGDAPPFPERSVRGENRKTDEARASTQPCRAGGRAQTGLARAFAE